MVDKPPLGEAGQVSVAQEVNRRLGTGEGMKSLSLMWKKGKGGTMFFYMLLSMFETLRGLVMGVSPKIQRG